MLTRFAKFAPAQQFETVLGTDSTATSFAALAPTATKPTNAVDLAEAAGMAKWGVNEKVMLIFFGTDAANEAFDARVVGWRRTQGGLWVPASLWEGTVTLGAMTGVSGYVPAATHLIADTLAADTAFEDIPGVQLISPADDTVASLVLETRGFELIEVFFDRDTAASGNALLARF